MMIPRPDDLSAFLNLEREHTVCFHSDHIMPPAHRKRAAELVETAIIGLVKQGKTTFISALGNEFEILSAETVIRLKQNYPIKCIILLPYYCFYFTGIAWSRDLAARAIEVVDTASALHCLNWELAIQGDASAGAHFDRILKLCSHAVCSAKRVYASRHAEKGDVSIINLYETLKEECRPHLAERRKSPVPAGQKDGIQSLAAELVTERDKTACFFLQRHSSQMNFDNWRIASGKILNEYILRCIQNGVRSFIVTMEDEFQVEAGRIVLQYRKEFPKLKCIVVCLAEKLPLSFPDWNSSVANLAKAVCAGADAVIPFGKGTEEWMKTCHRFYVLSLCGTVIFDSYPNVSLNGQSVFYKIAEMLGLHRYNLYEDICGEQAELERKLRVDAFSDIIYRVTGSSWISLLSAQYLDNLSYEQLLDIIDGFYRLPRGPNGLPDYWLRQTVGRRRITKLSDHDSFTDEDLWPSHAYFYLND